jgi:hypothetical protein
VVGRRGRGEESGVARPGGGGRASGIWGRGVEGGGGSVEVGGGVEGGGGGTEGGGGVEVCGAEAGAASREAGAASREATLRLGSLTVQNQISLRLGFHVGRVTPLIVHFWYRLNYVSRYQ